MESPFEFIAASPGPRLKRRTVTYTQSPTSPKPTSSLARRRRSLIISTPPASSASLNSIINQAEDCVDGDGDGDELMAQASEVLNEDAITQAMTLLSLHPSSSQSQHANWPDPEELLKESLRQSLSALRTLRESKKVVEGIHERRRETEELASPTVSGPGVFEVEAMYERIVGDMRGAREVLGWAEQQMEMEKGVLRERLLKG
ncbi:hypothetical protein K440DRAFT_364484 [Wilcoxina mikolae CBS 423.85]|nr:hypothetical protein K440DRAFT_364484 [Wilcoxina mikolae CBS 423.85]